MTENFCFRERVFDVHASHAKSLIVWFFSINLSFRKFCDSEGMNRGLSMFRHPGQERMVVTFRSLLFKKPSEAGSHGTI